MKEFVLLIIILLSVSVSAQEMIATIEHPVQTEFGTYKPYPVNIIPQATTCDPGDNLQNVINLSDFSFSEPALTLLKQNHFVVTPAIRKLNESRANAYNEMFDIYNENRELGIPIFVTTDALLHTFHLCFDFILRTCEEKRFIGQLNILLNGLLSATQDQYNLASDDVIKKAIMMNLEYLIVAKKLLDSTYVEPINGGKYLEELQLISQADGFHPSPIFEYEEDYSQYIVRGHYTRTDSLKHYFKSMMWLGRMTFACRSKEDPQSREATRRALLLVQAMSRLEIDGTSALRIWDDIYQPTVFFVGKSDDINFYQYLSIAQQVYGNGFPALPPDDFADETLLTSFLTEVENLPGPMITYPGQPKGFRFMGQRFIPDSWILDELVYNKIPDRYMPTGLDVMIVLGSEQAYEHLSEQDKSNPFYMAKLDTLKQIFKNYPSETWAQNAYWNWLYSLMPLLFTKGTGYPYFMQTLAWVDKDLYAALASWAELRHDTILYAKQSGTETGMPKVAVEKQGYVEPNPHFYGRLASLAEFMIEGLKNRNLLFGNFKPTLEALSDLLLRLKEISEKELTNTPLSSDDYLLIFDIGKTLYDIVTFSPWPSEGPMPEEWSDSDLEPMPVIADVHTDANSELVLEEGVGYPYAIYVICNVEGQLILTRGAGFSYYEFTWPMNDRLTDEVWRNMLKTDTPPQPPQWTSSFFASPDQPTAIIPDYYFWRKPATAGLKIELEPEAPRVGDTINLVINLSYYDYPAETPVIWVTTPSGEKIQLTDIVSSNPNVPQWTVQFSTEGFSEGMVYIELDTKLGYDSLSYRTSFYLHRSTGVPEKGFSIPERFFLYQNQPNPFNPITQIRFDLPQRAVVTLDIFNSAGRAVRDLSLGSLQPGAYSILWDGTDQQGSRLSSGVYFYCLQAGQFRQVKRMILLR